MTLIFILQFASFTLFLSVFNIPAGIVKQNAIQFLINHYTYFEIQQFYAIDKYTDMVCANVLTICQNCSALHAQH